ncbi:SDR family oxidoreductase [Lichenicoccus roseus]|uniref:SDR family oxidoreductase n=1 Tax=Lichenicoccus roseus TaxID=2683649 RepID=A0A5R9IZK9_9PROT|nr:SDR family oxidoreductase [Lichenicoccus roseus]TLU70884.1 SDR family oxidoreductase [Lichenicoccus roseus]
MTGRGSRLQDRVCVVAGALGTLGEAVARRLAEEGGIVVGIDRRPHAIGTLALQADLADEAQVQAAYARIHRELGRIDVIHNNAGLIDQADHSALTTSLETWNAVLAGNLTTTWLSCRHGIPVMLRNRPAKGSVINTASFLAGMGAASAQMAFNVAKAGVEQLSRDLGVHLARSGVRVNSLALGPIETPQLRQTFDRIGPEEAARRFVHMPMGRFGTVEEFAATIAYLASDDSGFVTASSFPLNGGIPAAFTVAPADFPPIND